MSKASQRRLAEQQKRLEKARKANPVMARIGDIDLEDVFYNPVRYWKKTLTIAEPVPANASHEKLEKHLSNAKAVLEEMHDAVYDSAGYGDVSKEADLLPGFVLVMEDGGVCEVRPKTPLFLKADRDTDWPKLLVDQYGPERNQGEAECAWLWAFTVPLPASPLFVLGATQDGAGRLWCRVIDKWITASDPVAMLIAVNSFDTLNFSHPHLIARNALKHGLQAGTIGRGSSIGAVPGTANAVSALVSTFAQPYLDLAVSLSMRGVDRIEDVDATLHQTHEEVVRVRADGKQALQNTQKLLAAERLITSGLRKELAARHLVASTSSHSEAAMAPPRQERSMAQRMGVFFGQ